MTDTPTPNWQPLSRLPLFTTMIDEAVVRRGGESAKPPGYYGLNAPKLHIWTSARTERGHMAGVTTCQDVVLGGVTAFLAV